MQIGFLVGSMMSGQFSDRLGRKRPFVYSSLLTTIFSFLSIFCNNIYSLLITRGLMGILGNNLLHKPHFMIVHYFQLDFSLLVVLLC